MLSLVDKALKPSSSYSDKILFVASVGIHQSVSSIQSSGKDNNVVNSIKDLITSSDTKLEGLQVLGIALQQNPNILVLANWIKIIFEILRDSGSHVLKEHACSVLCTMIPLMAKDSSSVNSQYFKKEVIPFLMEMLSEDVEWMEGACKCVHEVMKSFPLEFLCYKDCLLEIILKQVSLNISSKSFEVFADCFSELPNCVRSPDGKVYREGWDSQYLTTLKTMQFVLNSFLSFFVKDLYKDSALDKVPMFVLSQGEKDEDVFSNLMKGVRRFINLSKCLSKMLSTHFKGMSVGVCIKTTLHCLAPLLQIREKASTPTIENEIFFSTLAQMQIAACTLIEAMILNFNLVHFSAPLCKLLSATLQSSKLSIATETVSHLRCAVWKLLGLLLCQIGSHCTHEFANRRLKIIDELLYDIGIEAKDMPQFNIQKTPRSKKTTPVSFENKRNYTRNKHLACREALKVLEKFIHAGGLTLSRESNEEISQKVLNVVHDVQILPLQFPYPYDDVSCRKNLYSVLLAIALQPSHLAELESLKNAAMIFANAQRDSNTEITGMCNQAASMFRLSLHPKRPPPENICDKQRISNVSNTPNKFPEWVTVKYVSDLPVEEISDTPEAATSRVGQSYHSADENDLHSEEYMEVQQHYPEQADEIQCNGDGDDILIQDVQSSSQCQDDVDSDEEDEEEDEDDERSYGEEEIHQDVQSENMYIPSTNKLQVLNPVHTNPETAENETEPEYEELRPCAKTEDDIIDCSNKNMHLNGVHNIVPDEDVPSSSSQPTVTNENGIYELEDEDFEQDIDDEEEEENVSFPAEKKVPEFYDPPVKRQKLDNDETNEELENDERERNSNSPTLSEMKADFCLNEVDDVKS